ncbi:MAG: AMP-binding protein [Geobacteraceae bacterium]|nr:AMP-binding protein [Geobacteraceae bacterium]
MNLLPQILQGFCKHGNRCAIVYRSGIRRFSYSYDDLWLNACKMASFLAAQGVNPGDRVIIWGPNHPCWAFAFWGIVARGAVAVPVDFMSGAERAQSITDLSGARFAVQSRLKGEPLKGISTVIMEDLELHLKGCDPVLELFKSADDDLCELVYTSGTTGAPKGVALSHRNLTANVKQLCAHIPEVDLNFCFLSLLPLSHMFEQTAGFLVPLSLGSTIIYLRTLKPSAIMEAFSEEDVFAMIAVPRLLQLLKSSIERELEAKGLLSLFCRFGSFAQGFSLEARQKLFLPIQRKFGSNFRMFVSGGAPLSPDTFRFWSSFGFRVLEGYGLSETSPVLVANSMKKQACGAVGWALPGVEIRILDGEVQARGDNVFKGYFNNDAATRDAFTADGWFRTGDLGVYNAEGALVIKGRAKEVIVTGAGINVYPDELEPILQKTAGLIDACVIGLDRGAGEEVHAVIVPDGFGRRCEEIIAEVNQSLDELHRITGFSIWPDPELPKTTTLKVQKFIVKKRLLEPVAAPSGGATGVTDKLCGMIARVLGCPPSDVREESFLVADLGLTSIARLELANAIEQEFRTDLDDGAIGPQARVCDLRSIIIKREKSPKPRGLRLWTATPCVQWLRRLVDTVVHRPLFAIYVNLKPESADRIIALGTPVMFISNHVSYLDQPTVMGAIPSQLRYRTATAAWAEFFFVNFSTLLGRLWKTVAFQYCSVLMGVFPLPQSSGFRATMQHMGRLVDRGNSLLIFPEGERTEHSGLLPFQKGLGVMVQELGIPVVPVAIIGLEKILPRGANWPVPGNVRVVFGDPIDFKGKTPDEIVRGSEDAVRKLISG